MATQRAASGVMIGGRQVPFSVLLVAGCLFLFTVLSIFSSRGQIRCLPVTTNTAGASGVTKTASFVKHVVDWSHRCATAFSWLS